MAEFHVISGSSETPAHPQVRKIGFGDIREALDKGVADFVAMPSHLVFLGLIYPTVGFILAASNPLQLLYPLMSGFALIGPFAAIGLYEVSRRRWSVLRSRRARRYGRCQRFRPWPAR